MAYHSIMAYFDTRAEAETARQALLADGIDASAISLLPEEKTIYRRADTDTAYDYRRDEGGFWSSMGKFLLPDEDRSVYAEGMSRGGVTMAIDVAETDYDRVSTIVERYGSVDLDAREAEWRNTGWAGYTADSLTTEDTVTGLGRDDTARLADRDEDVIPIVEERLQVGKRVVQGGRVRVRAYVREVPVEVPVELREDHVTIERRPVDRAVEANDAALFQDKTIEAVERREEAVIAKEARVVEEISIRQQADVRQETIHDTVRRTEVEVEDERSRVEGVDPDRLRDETTRER